jgi:23S rRNA pseudouridine1911/1915/1917 synthase
MAVTHRGKPARTAFRVIERFGAAALLECRLETGRTHQIRVHLTSIDLPVSGDPTYGVRGDLGLARQFLHANSLRFRHPVTGTEVDVSSELPGDLVAALELARAIRRSSLRPADR